MNPLNCSLTEQLSPLQQNELTHINELTRAVRQHPDEYEYCFSNYYHFYQYWYCPYRYFEDEAHTKAGSGQEHLLKHTERVANQMHERLNIIFIDPHYIIRPMPHDNKFVDGILNACSNKIRQGVTILYPRKT